MPVTVPSACPLCTGSLSDATIREHNLRCAEYGERVYLGRDDPRVPVVYRIRRASARAVRKASEDGAHGIDKGDASNAHQSRTEG